MTKLNKKLLCVLSTAALSLALASCAGNDKAPSAPTSGGEAPNAAQSQLAPDKTDAQGTMQYGKVSGVVGNELSVKNCKTPEGYDSIQFFAAPPEAADSEEKSEGGGMVAATMALTPATAAGGDAGGVQMDKVDKNEVGFDVEFTGEESDVTVPAGVQILDTTGKGRSAVTDIKEGNIIGVDIRDGKVYGIVLLS